MKLSTNARVCALAGIGSILAALPATAQATISELHASMPGADNDEFFELVGAPAASLDGLTYLVIGDSTGGGSGVIENVTDLTGQVINSGGFFVAAEGTFTIGTADFTTSLNFENSDQVTHLLVNGFTGSNGDDLDTDDDGILDVTPWTSIVDCIALVGTGGDQVYCSAQAGPDGTFVAAHAYISNCGNLTTGDFDLADDTPGAANGPSRGFSTFRNGGGTNPAGFTEDNQSAIGGTWDVSVDIATPGALASIVAVAAVPTSGIVLTGSILGEVLCLPPYTLDIAVGTHSLAIPNDCTLIGTRVCTQAATFLPGNIQLQNGLDLTL